MAPFAATRWPGSPIPRGGDSFRELKTGVREVAGTFEVELQIGG